MTSGRRSRRTDRLLVLDVTVEVLTGTVSYITPSSFQFISDDGQPHAVASNAFGCAKTAVQLSVGLSAGEKRRGQIDFDLPTGGEVRYLVPTVDGATAAWRIPAAS